MKQGWEIKKLGEVCESDLGKTLNQSTDTGELQPYLCAINVLWDKIELSTVKQTRFEKSEMQRYFVRKGDLLICEGGDIGRAAIWDKEEPMLYQNALHRVRFDGSVLPRFCLLYLRSLKDAGILDSRYGKGVTIKHLVKSSLLSIPIPVPPISEQERIVEELDLLSGIIEKQKQQLKEYDTLAQSIFYTMFGDPITNEKGWEVRKVIDVVKMQRGFDLPVQDRDNEGVIPIYGSNGVIGLHSTYKAESGIITGRSGTLGEVYSSNKPFWPLNTTLFSVDTHGNDVVYLKYLMRNFHLERFKAGAGVPTLNRNEFHNEFIPNIPITLQQEFASKIETIEKQKELIKQSLAETETLFNSRMDYYFN
ncbi:MAG: restriction endonuclease subunit S [Bacteroidaceae bacterium]|nr:restriction endonuclease subunit S [Bacteroidaceae bacterium]